MFAVNERLLDVEAGNNALNEAIDELLSMSCDLNDANTRMSNANEIMKKEIEDLKVKDENKSKRIEMLYAIIQNRLVDNEEVLGSSSQEEQQPDVEFNAVDVNVENALVLEQQFELVSKENIVSYNKEDNAWIIEIERRRLKAKEAKKTQADEIVYEENNDKDDDMKDIDDFHESRDNKGDDDDQGGNGGALVIITTTNQQNLDFLDDAQNEEVEDVHP
ncbi:hypothetical protein Hanom_Chr06g00554321 [Helianthus anomalus]